VIGDFIIKRYAEKLCKNQLINGTRKGDKKHRDEEVSQFDRKADARRGDHQGRS
jgi:hypothetical protein